MLCETSSKAILIGRKFDAIYIDACSTAFPNAEEMPCPVHGFLSDRNIANLKAVLKKTGKLVS